MVDAEQKGNGEWKMTSAPRQPFVVQPRSVPKDFREEVKRVLSESVTGASKQQIAMLMRYVAHVLATGKRDPLTHRPVMSAGALASIAGKPHDGSFKAIDTLNSIKVLLPEIEWSESHAMSGKARALTSTGVPQEVKALWKQYVLGEGDWKGDLVEFGSGKKFSTHAAKSKRNKARADAQIAQNALPSHPEAQKVLGYVSGLSPRLFTHIVSEGWEAAWQEVENIEDPEKQRLAAEKLLAVRDAPQPVMGPSKDQRTPRVFAKGSSILGLPRAVRSALTDSSCIWLDLSSSQFAIVAVQWDAPEVEPFLRSSASEAGKVSIWHSLIESLGPEGKQLVEERHQRPGDFEQAKDVVKQFFYALVFGAGPVALRTLTFEGVTYSGELSAALNASEDKKALGKRLLGHPVPKALLKARKRRAQEVVDDGGAFDCFGKWIPVAGKRGEYSVLAQLAQAQEMQLMLPAIDLAAKRKDKFDVAFWLHDGIAIRVKDEAAKDAIVRSVTRAVDEEAARHGIKTFLERQN